MNRWLVAVLVLLAVVILVSPGIVGKIAEENMEQGLEMVESGNPGVDITTESFDRGWFSSAGRHRLEFDDADTRELVAGLMPGAAGPNPPALIITTRIDHGLVPVTSLARDAGTLMPGLASAVSTFEIDPGNGEAIALPGRLFSNVGLNGASRSRFLLEPGSFEQGGAELSWQGSDLDIYTDPSSGDLAVAGRIEPFAYDDGETALTFGAISIDVDQAMSDYGFNVGPGEFDMAGMTVREAGQTFTIGRMFAKGDSEISDTRLNASATFEMSDIEVPDFGNVAIAIDVDMTGIDAATLGRVTRAIREASADADPETALQNLFPSLQPDLQTLVASGAGLRIGRFEFTVPQGTLESTLEVDIGETADGAAFSWPAVLLATDATVNLRIPAALYDFAAAMNPQTSSLLAMGIIRREGEWYLMDAEYADGVVTVNGAPMPVPLDALR